MTEERRLTVDRFLHLPDFLSGEEQVRLVRDALACHWRNADPCLEHEEALTATLSSSEKPKSLYLGLRPPCGGPMHPTLPVAVDFARRAFLLASETYQYAAAEERERWCRRAAQATARLGGQRPRKDGESQRDPPDERPDLTGIALLYGPMGRMAAHCDSPTQPGQTEEWLAMLTVGNTVRFRCDEQVVMLKSGDALVMDSASVLHGVEDILTDPSNDPAIRFGLPLPNSRLGVLLWQAATTCHRTLKTDDTCISSGGVLASLFSYDTEDEAS